MTPAAVNSIVRKLVAPVHRRVMMMIARGLVGLVDDTGSRQLLQVKLLADEILNDVERFQEYGLSSSPPVGSELIFASVLGARAQGVVICVENRKFRLSGLAAGEIALHDDQGQKVHLKRAGIDVITPFDVNVQATGTATVSGQKVVIQSGEVDLGAEGGQPVARVGDTVSGGKIISGSSTVKAA